MDVTGLLILLLPALSTPSLAASREYHLVNLKKYWVDAQSYCRENFHDLAAIENEEDWAVVREMIMNSPDAYMWVGLYDNKDSWRWSLEGTFLYEAGNTNLGSWFDFRPDDQSNAESCVCMHQGVLHDTSCADQMLPVCYDEASNTFIPVMTNMNWLSAQSYCRQTYTDLASLRTQEEWDAFMSVTDTVGYWWVGLIRDRWTWSDGSNATWRKWDAGQPDVSNADCVAAQINGWHDGTCNQAFRFFCSVPIKKVLRVVLKTDGSVDLNDPQVQEAALKQVEKQLGEQGVHQKFRLSWKKQSDGKVFMKTEL